MSTETSACIALSFQLSFRETYKACVAISLGGTSRLRIARFFVLTVVLGCAVFVLFINNAQRRSASIVEGIISGALLALIVLSYTYFLMPYVTVRRLYKSDPNLGGPFRYSFSDDLILQEATTARSEVQWATFIKVKETKQFFLLYMRKLLAQPLPKRAFSGEAQIGEFRELVRRHIKEVSLRR